MSEDKTPRDILEVEILFDLPEDLLELRKDKNLRDLLRKEVAFAIEDALNEDEDFAVVATLPTLDGELTISRTHFGEAIDSILKWYEEKEAYATCSRLIEMKARVEERTVTVEPINDPVIQNAQEALSDLMEFTVVVRAEAATEKSVAKKAFVHAIGLVEECWDRNQKLYHDFKIDNSTYDDLFFRAIESLMFFAMPQECTEAVLFYVYGNDLAKELGVDKKEFDKGIIPYIDSEGKEYTFETADDLFEYVWDLNQRLNGEEDAEG